jgi:D-xylose 1-dehydrogenase
MTGSFARYPSLTGKVALVTGGASGIGADIVRALHGQGCKVAFLDLQADAGAALARDLPGALFLPCDLTHNDDVMRAIATVRETLGPIAILVNNAANDDRRKPMDIDEAYWDWAMDVNLKHQFFAAQAVMPGMREGGGGAIINFSSIAWRFGADDMTAYATAKAAVIGLTKALARNFGVHNIRVNAIEPGAVITEKQRQKWYPKQEQIDAMVSRQKIRRVLTADEIARAVLFLASDDSRMITGQTLVVDAGMS